MHRQLKLIHQMLRSDLAACRDLAGEVAAGAPAAAITNQIVALQTRSPIWTLRVNCLYHCRVVHGHHGLEDADMFPPCAVRTRICQRSSTSSRRITERSPICSTTSRSRAGALDDTATNPARQRLVTALGRLEDDLLAHLAFEEESIGATMRAWEQWP